MTLVFLQFVCLTKNLRTWELGNLLSKCVHLRVLWIQGFESFGGMIIALLTWHILLGLVFQRKKQLDMSNAIAHYNKHMRGVDKMDHIIALHPCKFKIRMAYEGDSPFSVLCHLEFCLLALRTFASWTLALICTSADLRLMKLPLLCD